MQVDVKYNDFEIGDLPMKIGGFILDNSLFNVGELGDFESRVTSASRNAIGKEDIDAGVSGILLFLIELNKVQPNKRLEESLLIAGENLINHCKSTSRHHYGFYKGRSGVSFTLIELSKATRESSFKDYALELLRNDSDMFVESEFSSNRLFDGRSGFLLVLLHIYTTTQEPWILEKITFCLNKIIDKFLISDHGVVWNKGDTNIKPLNSFLYGSSGVAFVLMQTAIIFRNDALFELAEGIFSFENRYWNDDKSNWPDFRNEIKSVEDFLFQRDNFKIKSFEYFMVPSYSYNWSHGLVGLCMARLPFLARWEESDNKCLLQKSISKLQAYSHQDLTLANGLSGIGSFYIEASKYISNTSYLERCSIIVNRLMNSDMSFQNVSLFHGITGIGYFQLQFIQKGNSRSILLPVAGEVNLREASVLEDIVLNLKIKPPKLLSFPDTILAIQTIAPECYKKLLDRINNQYLRSANYFKLKILTSLRSMLIPENYLIIKDIFKYELAKLKLYEETKSYSLNNIKEIQKFRDIIELVNMDVQGFSNQILEIDKESQIVNVKWDWARLNEAGSDASKIIKGVMKSEPQEQKIVIKMNERNEVIGERLDTFGQLTMSIFENPIAIHEAYNCYLEAFDIKNDVERVQILALAKQSIKYYIKKSLLHRSYL